MISSKVENPSPNLVISLCIGLNLAYEFQRSPLCSFGPFLIYRTNPEYEYQSPHNAEERGLVSFMQFWSFFSSPEP